MSETPFPSADVHVIDTNCFIVFERHDAIDLLERWASANDVTLLVPNRVYDELTPAGLPYDSPPVDRTIEAGWVERLDEPDYENSVVSATMDTVRQYVAAADDRGEHAVEQADAAVGGATATILERGHADSVAVYTSDVAAGRGIERALADHGYGGQVQIVDSFEFFEAVGDRYRFHG